jgi:hypothetical protein
MNRREFLRDATRALLVLPFGTFLVSCADDDDDVVTSTNPTQPPLQGPPPDDAPRVEGGSTIYTSSQTNAHSHSFAVALTDFSSPPAGGRIGATTEAQLHSHVLAVSQDVLQRAAAGESVQVETTSVVGHTHTFTIVRVV